MSEWESFDNWWKQRHTFATDSDRLDWLVEALGSPFATIQNEAKAAWEAALADVLLSERSRVRRAALEEAAKVCEGYEGDEPPESENGPDTWDWHAKDYARAIRALAEKGGAYAVQK